MSKDWKKPVILVCLLVFTASMLWLFWLWQQNHPSKDPQTLRLGLSGQITTINPLLAQNDAETALSSALFRSLYRYDTNGILTPDLAEGLPSVEDQGRRIRVFLKKDLKWSDGQAISADDFIFTYRRTQTNSESSLWQAGWQNAKVSSLSDTELIIEFPGPTSGFARNLTMPLLPEHAWKDLTGQLWKTSDHTVLSISSGQWLFDSITTGKNTTVIRLFSQLDSADSEAGGKTLELHIFTTTEELKTAWEKAKVDAVYGSLIQTKTSKKVEQKRTDIALGQYLAVFFNTDDPILRDLLVRQALSLALSKKEIAAVWQPDSMPISSTPLSLAPYALSHADTNAAVQNLEQAGWTLNQGNAAREKNTQQLKIELLVPDEDTLLNAAETIRAQWASLGVDTVVTTVDENKIIDERLAPRQFQALLFTDKKSPEAEPFSLWHSSQKRSPGLNITGLTEAEIDRLVLNVARATAPQDKKEREQKLSEALDAQYAAAYIAEDFKYFTFRPDIYRTPLPEYWLGGHERWLDMLAKKP